jgi:hypothetical protein
VPQDTILPLPYGDDFESYAIGADARYSASTAGYFEVYRAPGENKTLRQMVPAKGLTWSIPKDNYPCATIGDIRWSDYEVCSRVRLEGEGNVALLARVCRFRDHGMAGYFLRVDHRGQWELGVANNCHGPNNFYTEKILASGTIPFAAEAWHDLTISADGNLIRAAVDGRQAAELRDNTYANGAVGYSTWAEAIQKDHEDIEAAKAIDGDCTTFWHSEFNAKAPLPQSLTVELGGTHRIREIRILPRQDGGHSYITQYVIYLSENGKTFTKAAEGRWDDDPTMKSATFVPMSAHFVRIEALGVSHGGKANASIAEVQILQDERP